MTITTTTTTTSLLIILISIGVYKFRTLYYPNENCSNDPPIELMMKLGPTNDMNINYSWNNVCDLFSLEYEVARNKFRTAVYAIHYHRNENNLDIETFTLPISSSLDLEDDDTTINDDLTTDIVIIKGNKPGIIVHTSATHGVEGYAGSAIQLAFLDMLSSSSSSSQQQIIPSLSNDNRPTIVLIHSINPYGMKYYRRVNENNVDLNRNCIDNFDQFVKERNPNIANYDTFREFVSPSRNSNMWDMTLGFWFNAIPQLIQQGFIKLKTVLVAGQYHHPTGFSFGGTKIQPSIEVVTKFLKEKGFDTGDIFWIDVHTGLGKFGKDTVMFKKRMEEDESTLSKFFPTAHHIVTPGVEDKKAMSGYELTRGIFLKYLQEKNPSGVYAIQEYGTLPALLVGRAMILENMIYHYGGGKKQKEEEGSTDDVGRQLLQYVFYPQSAEWRASIVQRGVALILQAIEYSNNSNTNNNNVET